ncbi:hypothetical protein FRC02_011279 [Tulasnella sp. 418]|nr:hypothetical protein FRC02_011279 [Tulasnella sp. 418]
MASSITEKDTRNQEQLAVPTSSKDHPSPESITLRSEEGNTKQDVEKGDAEDPDERYVTGFRLFLIFIGMIMSIFLVALDQTIVATAIPVIASQFNALEEVTWIASAYFLTQAGFILTYGQLLSAVSTKWVYLVAVILFEIGSLICGVAPNMKVLIFGRAFAGVGAAGIFVACLSIIAQITRLEQRPVLFGAFGACLLAYLSFVALNIGLSSVIGPLLGGAFTDHVSWRWCFYINLPFGAITVLSIILFIKKKHTSKRDDDSRPTWRRLLGIDWVGTTIAVGMVTALLLPLQWGGVTKPWSDKAVIACFVVFGVVLIAFVAWEWYMDGHGVLPLEMFKSYTQIGACVEAFFIMLCLLVGAYYLPLYYQSSLEHSATRSGIDILPFMLAVVVGAGISGGVISKTGYPKPFLVGAPLIASLASGLIFWNLTETNNRSHLIGFQILLGVGVGGALQASISCILSPVYVTDIAISCRTLSLLFKQNTMIEND